MVKNGYYGNEDLSLAWDLGVIFFRRTKFAIWWRLKKNIWSFGSEGVIEKWS